MNHSTRSRESIKSCRSRSICCRSRKKRVCHCRRIREARKQASPPRKKKRIRSRCKTLKKNQTPLCICVKGSSSQDLRKNCKCPSTTCPMLSKYDDCCCIRKKVCKATNFSQQKKGSIVIYYFL